MALSRTSLSSDSLPETPDTLRQDSLKKIFPLHYGEKRDPLMVNFISKTINQSPAQTCLALSSDKMASSIIAVKVLN